MGNLLPNGSMPSPRSAGHPSNAFRLGRVFATEPQFFDVPVTEGICEIPTNALQDHVLLKMPAFEGYGCHDGLPLK